MKVERTRTSAAQPTRAATRTEQGDSATAGRRVSDSTAILGIPEAELTPKVRAAIMGLMEEVQKLREDLRRGHQRIEYLERLADQDSLLPVHNRRAFVRELTRTISIAERYGTGSTVLFFDLDGMKQINDRYGHAAGDAALKRVAEVLVEQVRESDIVGRLGGDEFGVILYQADEEVAQAKGIQLAEIIGSEPVVLNEDSFELTVTYGAYTFTGQDDAAAALAAADRAMYARKRSGAAKAS
jgi:diguanylate cyclase (GGDEF)-like protein